MTATFLLIRHAAHIHLDKRLSGRMPGVPLSEAGRSQAARLGVALWADPIDAIVTSPLDRTRETANAISAAALHGKPGVVVEEALTELDMGEWTGRALDSFGDDPAWRAWNSRRGSARIPGGETMREAQSRIVDRLRGLAGENDGRLIAVVTHSDIIRAIVAYVLGLSLDNMSRFDVDPASITRVVWGDWGARLMSLNEKVD